MIPVLSIVGSQSGVGKTTILCKIIRELKKRGYKVATIKHHKGDFEIDYPGKDTWKHFESGADVVILASPTKLARIERLDKEYSLDEIISQINNVDIIITEGYKMENKPKIEVLRKDVSKELISKWEELIGVVTDFPIDKDIPQFSFEQVEDVVNLIENKFLKSKFN